MNSSSSHIPVLCRFGHNSTFFGIRDRSITSASPLMQGNCGVCQQVQICGNPEERLSISRSSLHPLNAISIEGIALVNIKRDYKKVLVQCDS